VRADLHRFRRHQPVAMETISSRISRSLWACPSTQAVRDHREGMIGPGLRERSWSASTERIGAVTPWDWYDSIVPTCLRRPCRTYLISLFMVTKRPSRCVVCSEFNAISFLRIDCYRSHIARQRRGRDSSAIGSPACRWRCWQRVSKNRDR
jgi:hypothetical protein